MQSNFIWHFGYKYLPKNYGYSFINISANLVLITRTSIENFASPLSPHLPTMLSHPNSPFQNPSQLSIPEDHVIKAKILLSSCFWMLFFICTHLSHRFGSDDWLNLCRISTIPMSRSLSWRSCEPITINYILGNITKKKTQNKTICRTEERSGSRNQLKERVGAQCS